MGFVLGVGLRSWSRIWFRVWSRVWGYPAPVLDLNFDLLRALKVQEETERFVGERWVEVAKDLLSISGQRGI